LYPSATSGQAFYNARYYDSALGRFIQADTIVPSPANPQSLNRYSYAVGNPLRYIDPSGHAYCPPEAGGRCIDDLPAPRPPSSNPNPYIDLQPETNTGHGEIIDFLVEPLLALDWPRFEIKAWEDSRYLVYISCWSYDFEIEFGQSLSGRLGHGRTWLLKNELYRRYSSDGQSWIAVGPNEIAYSPSMLPLPSRMTRRGASVSGEARGVAAVKFQSGVVQASSTIEWTSIYQIPGIQTRETKYIRVASNTYYRRYAATAVDVAGIVVVGKVLAPVVIGGGAAQPVLKPLFR